MRFIKLSTLIINTQQISHIYIEPNKYKIYMMSSKLLNGTFLFGGGGINTDEKYFEVCKEKHRSDYHIVSEWIRQI